MFALVALHEGLDSGSVKSRIDSDGKPLVEVRTERATVYLSLTPDEALQLAARLTTAANEAIALAQQHEATEMR